MRWLRLALLVLAVAALSPATGTALGETDGDQARGEELFQANCAMCHGADASGMMGMHPALRGAVDRLTAEGVEVTIRNGRDTRPPMPAFGGRLDDGAIADLVAYLDSLPTGPRNFGPEGAGGGMAGGGMGGMMQGGPTVVWGIIVLVVAALAGVVGYLLAQRRS